MPNGSNGASTPAQTADGAARPNGTNNAAGAPGTSKLPPAPPSGSILVNSRPSSAQQQNQSKAGGQQQPQQQQQQPQQQQQQPQQQQQRPQENPQRLSGQPSAQQPTLANNGRHDSNNTRAAAPAVSHPGNNTMKNAGSPNNSNMNGRSPGAAGLEPPNGFAGGSTYGNMMPPAGAGGSFYRMHTGYSPANPGLPVPPASGPHAPPGAAPFGSFYQGAPGAAGSGYGGGFMDGAGGGLPGSQYQMMLPNQFGSMTNGGFGSFCAGEYSLGNLGMSNMYGSSAQIPNSGSAYGSFANGLGMSGEPGYADMNNSLYGMGSGYPGMAAPGGSFYGGGSAFPYMMMMMPDAYNYPGVSAASLGGNPHGSFSGAGGLESMGSVGNMSMWDMGSMASIGSRGSLGGWHASFYGLGRTSRPRAPSFFGTVEVEDDEDETYLFSEEMKEKRRKHYAAMLPAPSTKLQEAPRPSSSDGAKGDSSRSVKSSSQKSVSAKSGGSSETPSKAAAAAGKSSAAAGSASSPKAGATTSPSAANRGRASDRSPAAAAAQKDTKEKSRSAAAGSPAAGAQPRSCLVNGSSKTAGDATAGAAAAAAKKADADKLKDDDSGNRSADGLSKGGSPGAAHALLSPASATAGGIPDKRIHAVAVLTSAAASEGGVSADQTVRVPACSDCPAPVKMDDVVLAAELVPSTNTYFADLLSNADNGHNTCLLVYTSGDASRQAAGKVVAQLLADMVGGAGAAAAKPDDSTHYSVSAAAFTDRENVRDLLGKTPSIPAKAVIGTNPICGPSVAGVEQRAVKTADEMRGLVSKTFADCKSGELGVLSALIKHVRMPQGTGWIRKDVYVCSCMVVLVDAGDSTNNFMASIRAPPAQDAPALLLARAVGGACRTLLLLPLDAADARDAAGKKRQAAALAEAEQVRAIENSPIRSGNLRRFVDFTEKLLKRQGDRQPADVTEKMRLMLQDAQKLMDDPETTPVKSYPVELNKLSDDTSSKQGGAGPAGAAAAAKLTSPSALKPIMSPSGAGKSRLTGAGVGGAAGGAAGAAGAGGAGGGDVSPSARPKVGEKPTDPQPQIQLGLVVERTQLEGIKKSETYAAALEGQPVTVALEESVYRTNLYKRVATFSFVPSLTAAYLGGENVALLSAETVSGVPLKKQATWQYACDMMEEALAPGRAGHPHIHLYMCIIRQREVLYDLMSADEEHNVVFPLVVASSPLFGPSVNGTASRRLTDAGELRTVVHDALDKVGSFLEETDVMLICKAVLQTRTDADPTAPDGDVTLSSLFVASSFTSGPHYRVVRKDPLYSRSLFACALGGPCRTCAILSLADDARQTEAGLRSLAEMHALTSLHNHITRSCGVKPFIEFAEGSLKRSEEELAKGEPGKAATEEEKTRLKDGIEKIKLMIEDHKALLTAAVKPDAELTLPLYLPGGERATTSNSAKALSNSGRGSANSTPGKGASLGGGSDGKGGDAQRPAPKPVAFVQMTLTDGKSAAAAAGTAGASSSAAAAERLEVKDPKAPPESASVAEVLASAAQGFNGAVLVSEAKGSTVGAALVSGSIAKLLALVPAEVEAYWTLCVIKGETVRDALAGDGAAYEPLTLATSPVFGPAVRGLVFKPLGAGGGAAGMAAAEVASRVAAAAEERGWGSGALVLAQVVLSIASADGQDVSTPSLLLGLGGCDVEVYRAPVKRPVKERGVLQYALGGPCHTAFVGVVRPSEEIEAARIVGTGHEMASVPNTSLRSCSIKRFIDFTRPALASMEKRKVPPSNLEKISQMVNDASEYLAAPKGKIPKVYKK